VADVGKKKNVKLIKKMINATFQLKMLKKANKKKGYRANRLFD
jgi:hypothetical protein